MVPDPTGQRPRSPGTGLVIRRDTWTGHDHPYRIPCALSQRARRRPGPFRHSRLCGLTAVATVARLLVVLALTAFTVTPVTARSLVPRPPDATVDQSDPPGPQSAAPVGGVFAEIDQPEAPTAPPDPVPANAAAFVTYPAYATQYQPIGDPDAVEVALPDLCVKFAARRDLGALALHKCPAGYSPDLDYRVVVTVESDGSSAVFPVRDVGPWNTDDNYWNPSDGPRPRRMFNSLELGRPQADAGIRDKYNEISNCWDMNQLIERVGPADQFQRCLLSPAGIDLSFAAAARLGLGPGVSTQVLVTFLWEPRSQ